MKKFPYLQNVSLKLDRMMNFSSYPFNTLALKNFESIEFTEPVTFIIGENGSGKSTLIEAIATSYGFNPEGGSKNFSFDTRKSHSELHEFLRLSKSFCLPKDGFFLRAESFFNLATNIETLDKDPLDSSMYLNLPKVIDSFGGESLHEQSHGESFMSLVVNRFFGHGLYILDEPEAALSPTRQLTLLARINQLCELQSQFIIATHSPILLAYPGAQIYQVTNSGLELTKYEDTEHYAITKSFLLNPERMLQELFKEDNKE
ncbi:AAA family ATPase [Pseudocolwellia sp. HL-MZ7]|uniref:AAA family ATPase n=1 Tax=Pseudocolwellia sp. HL-MZ7 TaxID=3400627 RepID=UPI003CF7FC9A